MNDDPFLQELIERVKGLEKRMGFLERLEKSASSRIYQATVIQNLTSNPFEDYVIFNTLGASITFTRSAVGQYLLTSSAFDGVDQDRVFVRATLAFNGANTANLAFIKTSYSIGDGVFLMAYRQNATTQAFEFADTWMINLEIIIHP